MKKLLLLLGFIPLFSFGQFDWKKNWNGNVELGVPLLDVGRYIKHDRFLDRGYIGVKVFNDSLLDGRLMLRAGSYMAGHYGNVFFDQEKHNQDAHISVGLQYRFFENKYFSPTVDLGFVRYKRVSYSAPSHYSYLRIMGVEVGVGGIFFPLSRVSIGVDLSIGFGKSIEYSWWYNERTMFTASKPFVLTLQYKIFQKEKIFGKNK